MELNAEQIKKALECCASQSYPSCCECPYHDLYGNKCITTRNNDIKDLINSQEQRIKDLEIDLKAMRGAANAYKKHIVELTEEAENWRIDGENYRNEVEDLRTENKSLHTSCTELAQKCASLNEENERLITICETKIDLLKKAEAENERLMRDKTNLECIVTSARNLARADTVRKMQERLKEKAFQKTFICLNGESYVVYLSDIDQIAKEMLEDKPCT